MSDRIVRAVLALYPRAFRRRYGPEVRDLVEELEAEGDRSRLWLLCGLIAAAAAERLRATRAGIAASLIALVALVLIVAAPSRSPTRHVTVVTAVSGEGTGVRGARLGPAPVVSGFVSAAPAATSTVGRRETLSEYTTSVPPPPPSGS
jgi:hypothetical protein